jgi:hypothetical protein
VRSAAPGVQHPCGAEPENAVFGVGCAVLHALDATLARRYSEGATIPITRVSGLASVLRQGPFLFGVSRFGAV